MTVTRAHGRRRHHDAQLPPGRDDDADDADAADPIGNVAAHTPAGGTPRVWLVNQDNDSVTVFDGVNGAKLGEVAVGAAPRSIARAPDGRFWVTNKDAASISMIQRDTLAVVQTVALPRGSMPFGLAFAPDGSAAYVALEGTGQLVKLHPTHRREPGQRWIVGANRATSPSPPQRPRARLAFRLAAAAGRSHRHRRNRRQRRRRAAAK